MCKGKKLNILGLNLTIHSQVYEPAEDTFLLLENLADYVKGERIIDVGCGCGIIGLYTLTVGAKEAILTDINPHAVENAKINACLLYTSPSPRDLSTSRMPSSA